MNHKRFSHNAELRHNAEINNERFDHGATVFNYIFVLFGGYDDKVDLSSLKTFDAEINKWN